MRVFLRSCCSCSLAPYVAVKSWRPQQDLQVEVQEHLSPLRANPQARRARKRTRKRTKKVWCFFNDLAGFLFVETLSFRINHQKTNSMTLCFFQEMELAVRKISCVRLWLVSSTNLRIRRLSFSSCVASCLSPTLHLCAGKLTASHCISTGT